MRCLGSNSQENCKRAIETIKRYLGTDNALYLSSGRAALWLYLKTLAATNRERREVIVPAYTCPSVVSAVLKAGLVPVLCDNRTEDLGLHPGELEKKLGRKTLAVVVVHLYGAPAKIDKIEELCQSSGACLVEDAAQAFGNLFPGTDNLKLGLKGDAGFYSFGRGKPISIMHGGLLVVNSPGMFHEVERIAAGLSSDAAHSRYVISLGSYALFRNPRLYWLPQMVPSLNLGGTVFEPEFDMKKGLGQAAVLLAEMISTLETEKEIRKLHSDWYLDNLTDSSIRNDWGYRGFPYLRYPIMIDDRALRARILEKLIEGGTGATGSYPAPLNELPKLKEVLADASEYAGAREISETIVTLPVHSGVSAADRENIKRIIRQVQHAN